MLGTHIISFRSFRGSKDSVWFGGISRLLVLFDLVCTLVWLVGWLVAHEPNRCWRTFGEILSPQRLEDEFGFLWAMRMYFQLGQSQEVDGRFGCDVFMHKNEMMNCPVKARLAVFAGRLGCSFGGVVESDVLVGLTESLLGNIVCVVCLYVGTSSKSSSYDSFILDSFERPLLSEAKSLSPTLCLVGGLQDPRAFSEIKMNQNLGSLISACKSQPLVL